MAIGFRKFRAAGHIGSRDLVKDKQEGDRWPGPRGSAAKGLMRAGVSQHHSRMIDPRGAQVPPSRVPYPHSESYGLWRDCLMALWSRA